MKKVSNAFLTPKIAYTEVSKEEIRQWLNTNSRFGEMVKNIPVEQIDQFVNKNHNSSDFVGLYDDFVSQLKRLNKDYDVNVSYNDFINIMKESAPTYKMGQQLAGKWFIVRDYHVLNAFNDYESNMDYQLIGTYIVQAPSVKEALNKVVKSIPVRMIPYHSNETSLFFMDEDDRRNSYTIVADEETLEGFDSLGEAQEWLSSWNTGFTVLSQREENLQTLADVVRFSDLIVADIAKATTALTSNNISELGSVLTSLTQNTENLINVSQLLGYDESLATNSEGSKLLKPYLDSLGSIKETVAEISTDLSNGLFDGSYAEAMNTFLAQAKVLVSQIFNGANRVLKERKRMQTPKEMPQVALYTKKS